MMSILKNDDSHNSKYIPSDCFRKLSSYILSYNESILQNINQHIINNIAL